MSNDLAIAAGSGGKVDRSFLLRRLHSLSGVLPIGGFLLFHMFENLAALKGPGAYNEMVERVNTMLPRQFFWAVELGLLGSIAFHALYGMYVAGTGKSNLNRYPYASNWAYWVQRFSGYVAFIYLIVHVGVLRVVVSMLDKHLAGASGMVTYADVAAHFGNPVYATEASRSTVLAGWHIFALYVVGGILSAYHFANGLNGFAWTWGLVVGRVAQKRLKVLTWGLFAVLSLAMLNILYVMRFGV